jgi:hypothetical protein
MLLNNFIVSLYPDLKATYASGELSPQISYAYSNIRSYSPDYYSETITSGHMNLFGRGIVFGSGTTPPRKQIIS